jgi:two-component system cell cycle response regulator DivK
MLLEMAGESILVVDDAPVNLRLAAAVLRSEGYRVHLASSAEQALMMLNTTRADLMLVDIRLPGMDGVELTRRVRQESRTRDMIVVALTAAVTQEDQQRAFEAGCDGYLTKPIDTRTLGQRVRGFLDGQAPPPAAETGSVGSPGMPEGLSLAGPEMESLRRGFLTDAMREVRRILEFLNSNLDAAASSRLFHQWVGAAGALGYMEIAQESRKAEMLLAAPGWTRADVREVLTNLAILLAAPSEAADTPIPESIVQQLTRKRIALVGFADHDADKICGAFERVRAMPYLFAADEPASDGVQNCTVVLVHVRPETMSSQWLQPDFPSSAVQPWVLVGGREDLLALDPKVQSRAVEYLIDGWQPEEAIMRLSFAVSRAEAAKQAASGPAPAFNAASARRPVTGNPEIVIADDDVHVLAVVRGALQNAGMDCRPASNGPEALRLVRDMVPHAAVLDVNMPGMDGYEVLAAIRKENLPVRVVILTARQHETDVLRGFDLGADDYVVKPFNPLELIARLKRLL